MPQYSVTTIGLDQPGLLAAVSGVLGGEQWNIVGSLSTVFHGYSVSAFIASVEGVVEEDVKAKIKQDLQSALPNIVRVDISDPLPPTGDDRPQQRGPWWMLWCNADDRPNVLSRVAGFIAGRRGPDGPTPSNIVEHHGGVNANGRCVMHFKLALHPDDKREAFMEDFFAWAEQHDVVVSHPVLSKAPRPPF